MDDLISRQAAKNCRVCAKSIKESIYLDPLDVYRCGAMPLSLKRFCVPWFVEDDEEYLPAYCPNCSAQMMRGGDA